MGTWTRHEVRNGQWISYEAPPAVILAAGPEDERTLERMRLDTITERAARAIAASRFDVLNTMIATVATLLGDDTAEQLRDDAYRLSADDRAR